jgi:DNA polymerase-3 subunit epsilon
MRQIVLDTETTGLNPAEGDRLVEIGCIEIFNHVPTGNSFHCYLNPERPMDERAFAVHGLSDTFLSDKPLFAAKAAEFLEFIGEDELVIHNASFDMAFLNWELRLLNLPIIAPHRAIDTLDMARKKFPGAQNSLDALCRRFNIDNSKRDKHGALLDASLLAEVYLELMGGRQPGLVLNAALASVQKPGLEIIVVAPRPTPLPPRLTPEERAAHESFVASLGPDALWLAVKTG